MDVPYDHAIETVRRATNGSGTKTGGPTATEALVSIIMADDCDR